MIRTTGQKLAKLKAVVKTGATGKEILGFTAMGAGLLAVYIGFIQFNKKNYQFFFTQ
jgi:hypothetical protein